jgi:hypothetical protein
MSFLGLSNGTTLMQNQSGRTVPLTMDCHLLKLIHPYMISCTCRVQSFGTRAEIMI